MQNEEHAGCPLCGTDNSEIPALEYSRQPWRLKKCRNCGMVYLENPIGYEQLEEDFAWERTFAAESKERRRRNPTLHAIGRFPKKAIQFLLKRDKLLHLVTRYVQPGPVLDVGCAGGHTLMSLPAQYIPYGIEISHELSQIAASAFAPRGGAVVQSDALTGLSQMPRGEFTGVIMTSFLEHEVNPKDTLQATRRVLHRGGKVIVKVPNYSSWNRHIRGKLWCGFRFPDHVNYFTPGTLKQLLAGCGFHVVRFGIEDRMPTSDTMWLVAEVIES